MPSHFNYPAINFIFYLAYALVAAYLSLKTIAVSFKSNNITRLLCLSRIGTLILTFGTFLDNLRTSLASFPVYPIENAPNATAATNAWKKMNYQGATLEVTLFWICDFFHIVLTSFSLFTVIQLCIIVGRKRQHSHRAFIGGMFFITALSVVSFAGFIVGPCSNGGILIFEEPLKHVYHITSKVKSPLMDGLLSVVVYVFGMLFVAMYALCVEHSKHRPRNICFLVALLVSLGCNGAAGGAR
jgi:hypothetical protein